MKRILSMILTLAMLLACLPVFRMEVHAETVASGTCGEQVTWTLDDAGTLTISGTGGMNDYIYAVVPWGNYRSSVKKVVINNGVTRISQDAFRDCTALTDLTLGDSITEIGGSSFSGCTSLTEVTIPASVTRIGSYAFSECTGLKEITFKGDAPSIDDFVFRDVTATAYYPGNSVMWIEDVRQNYGGTITWMLYGEPVTLIASGTCGNNATWALDDAGTLTIFGTSNTFSYKNASETPWYPYYSSIKSVIVKDGINTLGAYLFAGCTSLTSVTLGNSISYIEGHAFQGCTGLSSVTFGKSISGIGDYVFQGCTGLTGMTIPDTVTSTGAYVFADCTGLSSVTFGNSLGSISSFMFANCTGLTSVTIPDSAKSINKSAFAGCTGLTSVTIGNSVEVIQGNAFASCVNLREIFFVGCAPTFKNQDGDGIFYNATATAYYPSIIDRWTEAVRQNYGGNITWVPYEREDVFIDSGACGLNLTWKLDTTGTLTISGTGDMYHFSMQSSIPWDDYRQYVKTVIMEDGVTSIGYRAFYECENLTSVTIPDSVISIGEDAFCRCYRLTSVTIPDSVTNLGSNAFAYCTGLTSVTIGDSLKTVTGFYGCTSLTSITFGSSVETINGLAFQGCTSLVSLTLPDTVKTIGWYVFSDCTNLTSVKLGSSVETVGVGAFSDCTSLNEIIFTGNAPTFERNDNIDLGALGGIVATAYYPGNDDTWTEEVRQGSDGQITWVAYGAPEIKNSTFLSLRWSWAML